MQRLSYILLVLSALATIQPVIGMGAFALAILPDNKQVLLLGDHHNYEEIKAASIAQAGPILGQNVTEETIFSQLRSVKPEERLTLIGELSSRYFNSKPCAIEPFFEKLVTECRTLLEQGKGTSPLLFVPFDPRSQMSDMVTTSHDWMSATILEFTSGEEIVAYNGARKGAQSYHAQSTEKKQSFTDFLKTFTFKKNEYTYSVAHFFAYLDQCLDHMTTIEEKYSKASKQKFAAVIRERIERFKNAQRELQLLMKGIAADTLFPYAFKSLFIGDDSIAFRMDLIKKCTELFLRSTDYLYADVCFLDKAIDTLARHSRVMLAVGASHHRHILAMLKQLDATVPLSDDILEEEMALNYQFNFNALHDIRLLQAIVQFLKAESHVPEEDAAILQCFHCFKQGVAKACGNCKIAYYCSAECQKIDWQHHKKLCKKSDGSQ